MQSSNENMINFKPDIDFVDPETIQISKHNGIPYLIITEPIHSERFEGYSVLIHSLEGYNNVVRSFIFCSHCIWFVSNFHYGGYKLYFSTQLTKPLVTMSNKMIQIRRDGFQNKLELKTNYEETDNLIDTFNDMMYQIDNHLTNNANLLKMLLTSYARRYKSFKVI